LRCREARGCVVPRAHPRCICYGSAMDDYSAICNLEGHYAHTWDTGDADGWAALFTADGAFEMVGVGDPPSVRYEGTTELAQFCRTIHKSVKGLHLMHTPAIDVRGDEADGWVHFEFRSS